MTLNVTANTQAVLTSPTVEQDTKLIKVTGEVGQPLIIYDAWTDFAGQAGRRGAVDFPQRSDDTGRLGLSGVRNRWNMRHYGAGVQRHSGHVDRMTTVSCGRASAKARCRLFKT